MRKKVNTISPSEIISQAILLNAILANEFNSQGVEYAQKHEYDRCHSGF